jgi:hypothetical protein
LPRFEPEAAGRDRFPAGKKFAEPSVGVGFCGKQYWK